MPNNHPKTTQDRDKTIDIEIKNKVQQELESSLTTLRNEHDKLYEYQFNFFSWFNRETSLTEEIRDFCEQRNTFLLTKLKIIRSCIELIENKLYFLDKVKYSFQLSSYEIRLRQMLISLGMSVPKELRTNHKEGE